MIKSASSYLVLGLFVSLMAGCLWDNETVLPMSSGKVGDIVVVMDSASWAGEMGLQIKKCFSAPQEGLPQSEALFNVIEIYPSNFTQIFKTTRNIIVIEKNKTSEKSTYVLKENLWANNQLALLINAGSGDNAAEIIRKNCEGMREAFLSEEIQRLQYAYEKLKDESIMELVEKQTGIRPTVPRDYKVAFQGEDLIWLRKDFEQKGHQVSMGIIIYTSPYDSVAMLESKEILAQRNERIKVVEGPVDGSYMSTYDEFTPEEHEIAVSNRYVKELRGLWNMKGAFMGGPFVHYTFVDPTGTKIIGIDVYVFAPKFDKREYLRELEAIAKSAIKPIS